ncbi:hypothetical protein ciss_19090, partial [Carboxydothermus islandicus]
YGSKKAWIDPFIGPNLCETGLDTGVPKKSEDFLG